MFKRIVTFKGFSQLKLNVHIDLNLSNSLSKFQSINIVELHWAASEIIHRIGIKVSQRKN